MTSTTEGSRIYTRKVMIYATIGILIGCIQFGYAFINPDSWLGQNFFQSSLWFPIFLVFLYEWRKMKIKKFTSGDDGN